MVEIMNHVKENNECLACGSSNIHTALDLGLQPLANAYKNLHNESEDTYPLGVNLCHDCYHLQLSHTVDPAIIYKNYLYATGTNQTIKNYSKWFAEFCKEYTGSASSVLDIGCNDGTQLNYFKDLGLHTFGIDPAENLYPTSSKNHNIVCDFFGKDAVEKLVHADYDIITAQNVFAHNPNPLEFLNACKSLMGADTLLFVQTSQADMVLNDEFDTIYHEHINFFNANSMKEVATRAGLYLIDVVKAPIHGNSYIFILGKHNQRPANVTNIIAMEQSYGLLSLKTYQDWERNVRDNVAELVKTLDSYRQQGFMLVGYGAAAKGNTLLNFSGINLEFIVDDSQLKQGKFTPGRSCPIVPLSELNKYKSQDKLLFIPLAWNFFTEIKSRIQAVRSNPTDKFVKYFPKVEVN